MSTMRAPKAPRLLALCVPLALLVAGCDDQESLHPVGVASSGTGAVVPGGIGGAPVGGPGPTAGVGGADNGTGGAGTSGTGGAQASGTGGEAAPGTGGTGGTSSGSTGNGSTGNGGTGNGGAGSGGAATGSGGGVVNTGPVASAGLPRDDGSGVSASDQGSLVDGNNAFAFDLYGQLASDPAYLGHDVWCSPLSISMALGMTSAGAVGQTQTEMAQALHFTLPQSSLQAAFNWLDLSLLQRPVQAMSPGQTMTPTLALANAIWGQQTDTWQTPFLDVLATDWGTGVHLGDFIGNPNGVAGNVNAWVSQQTDQRIKNLLPPGSVTSSTRVVLVNAIDLAFPWESPFDPDHSRMMLFTPDGEQPLQINTMNDVFWNIFYAEDAVAQAVWLPLAGNQLTVEIYLPKAGGLASIEPIFAAETASLRASRTMMTTVGVSLPAFTFTTPTFPISPALKALGMTTAFTPLADFSGMTTTEPLHVDEVYHEAMLGMNETGVQAAAATAVLTGVCGGIGPAVSIDVNHSFMVIIRDEVTGSLLFLGRIVDPNEQGAVPPVQQPGPC